MLLNRVAFCFKHLKKNQFVLRNKVFDTSYSFSEEILKNRSIVCVCVFLFYSSLFCDFRFYTSNKQNAISKKLKSLILLKIGMHFGKLLFKINVKFQRISNSHF